MSYSQDLALLKSSYVNFKSLENASTDSFPIGNFLNKMRSFYFCPPSDNLWTVEITLSHDSSSSSLGTTSTLLDLYNNIIKVNKSYSNNISTNWGITFDTKETTGLSVYTFIKNANDNGIFLANKVTAASNSATMTAGIFPDFSQRGSFITPGKVAQSKNGDLERSITFLASNWNIGEILFDPWIAAISQQGLIESSDSNYPTIKADIYITEYARSISGDNLAENGMYMVRQKQITLKKAFPISRDQLSLTYEYESSGTFKSQVIKFKFDEYSIKYFA